MHINVKVKANSSKEQLIPFGNNRYLVYLKEPPENNRANARLINLLAHYFHVPITRIKITFGTTSDDKLIEII